MYGRICPPGSCNPQLASKPVTKFKARVSITSFSLAYKPKHCALVSGRQTEMRNTQTEHLSAAGFTKGRYFGAPRKAEGYGRKKKSTKHGFLGKQSSRQSDLCSPAPTPTKMFIFIGREKQVLGAGDTHSSRQPRSRPAFEDSFLPIFLFSLKYDFIQTSTNRAAKV